MQAGRASQRGQDVVADDGFQPDIILAIAIALGLIFVMTAWALRSLRSAEAAGA